ncbi:MAG: hypothetical protein Q9213_000303 [Squamulea squamosa]
MANPGPLRLLLYTLLLLSSSLLAPMAQQITATNDAPAGTPQFDLSTGTAMSNHVYQMDYLTDYSGQLQKGTLEGNLTLTTPSNVNTLLGSAIAYISCDDEAYTGNVGPSQTFRLALMRSPPPISIVLYSVNATRCTLVPNNVRGTIIYSMKDSSSSSELLGFLQSPMDRDNSTIEAHKDTGGGGGILGKSPTTAVAMIILYSITGIITALFLIIIVVGAIRAHRHPERYGPRNVVGRTRQSRAKGIARAMLETIPIVKFGDNGTPKTAEPTANPERDIEMAPPRNIPETSSPSEHYTPTLTSAVPNEHIEANNGALTAENLPTEAVPPQNTNDPTVNADNGLACSVCTDDFTKGQDVRVLPCNHKFHPECIDPWLLNVSGTCPMCRVDLRPTTSNENPNQQSMATSTSIPQSQSRRNSEAVTSLNPALQNQSRRSSRARPLHYLHHYLNRGRMEEATPQERLEALRRLRLVNRSDVDAATQQSGTLNPEVAAAGGNRNSLSARLSRAFGGDRSRPVSGVPSMHGATPAVPERREVVGEETTTGSGTAVPSGGGTTGESRT